MDMILAATKLWFSKGINNKTLVPAEVKDTAIWLLVSTDLDADAQSNPESPATCWRLALLVRNQVIFGSQLDPRYHTTRLSFFTCIFSFLGSSGFSMSLSKVVSL